MQSESREFPIMTSKDAEPHPMSVPWSIAELAYSQYAQRYGTDQSLERLAERGGFGACEMDIFLPDWRERCSELSRLITLLTDIRFALGDDGKRMQDELVEYCKEIIAERGRLREWVKGLTAFATYSEGQGYAQGERYMKDVFRITDVNGREIAKGKTPLEAVEAYLNSNSGVEGQDEA